MKLIAGALNKQTLMALNTSLTPKATEIKAAVAYASNDCMELFQLAEQHKVGLKFFGRYDATVAVAPAVISWFLDRAYIPNLTCRLIADFYHPKVIWWLGQGVYIGSANLTERAWTKNIEIGAFFTEDDIQANGLDVQLDHLFSEIEDRSHAITPPYLKHLKELLEANKTLDKEIAALKAKFALMRIFPVGDSFVTIGKKSVKDRKKERFQRERLQALETLYELEALVTSEQNRPAWIPAETAKGVQVDQFLYAYHSKYVKGFGSNANVESFHASNINRRAAALSEALCWWRAAEYSFQEMSLMVNKTAARVEYLLSKEKLPNLNLNEFCEALSEIHAVRQFVMNKSNAEMGLPPEQTMAVKLRRHGEELWAKRSVEGKTPLETLYYLIWGSDAENIETRLWNASNDEKWALPWTRESTLGDTLGWARPNDYPPINGRSMKALRALGYEVEADEA